MVYEVSVHIRGLFNLTVTKKDYEEIFHVPYGFRPH